MEPVGPRAGIPPDGSARSVISRRALLGRGASTVLVAGVGPALLAACGSSDSTGTAASKASGRIDFISWEGYDAPDAMAKFKRANDIALKATYMGSHDEIQTKILAAKGRTSFDLITYAQDYQALYTELKILTPINEEKIPNLKNLFPFFAGGYRSYQQQVEVGEHRGPLGSTVTQSTADFDPAAYVPFNPPRHRQAVELLI